MANPTSNFGWQMPTSTDLVTDLPADFETFGQAVDTSLADLKGGTTGQILSKASGTDMDFTWITNDVGDITAVTASSPLTGGGTSGAITVGIQDGTTAQKGAVQLTDSTSSTSTTTAATPNAVKSAYDLANGAIAKSLLDAKADLIVATAADTPDRLAVGTNGQVLTADSTTATGLKWATPAASSFSGASVYKTGSNQNINNGTWTVLVFDSEYFDTDSYHSTTTNTGRFTIGTTGYYQIGAQLAWSASSSGIRHHRIVKNGSTDIVYRVLGVATPSGSEVSYEINYLASLTSGDYIEFQVYQDSGGTLTADANPNRTFFTINKVG